ncbi:MAG TPA: molecular chaperone HtpG [Waddliaceae bacterium]
MTKKALSIHSENILPIIKRWLYSDKDIFVRELVANACDAIHKLKILRDHGEVDVKDEEFRIDIHIDKEKRTLTFNDTGIGMDASEVEKYIAQIAFSSAEEFLEKYKTNQEGDQIIGHFGLGFYSAYMAAEKVEIETLSYKGATSVFWSCDGSSEYILEKGHRQTRGTEITLFIDKNSEEFLEENRLKEILRHYCAFLPYPIFLENKQINTHTPLWIKAPSECSEKDYLEFYRYLYPFKEDPLFWIHLNVDYPFHLKGILYFPKVQQDFDFNKNTVRLYCNRVFVSDNCKDVIPHYLMALQGVIDSPDIPLNISRSYLQMDRTVRQLSSHISKKVSDSLNSLYRSNRERFIKCWEDISALIKLGAIEDEKFYEKIKDILLWKVVDNGWTTVEEYLERNKEKTKDKILYTKDEKHLSHFIDLYKKRNIEILNLTSNIDSYLIHYLEPKIAPVQFQRIDGGIDENILDKEREKTILDAQGKTEASKLADLIRMKLVDHQIDVEAKSLASDQIPGFVLIEENQRRMRDYMQAMNPESSQQHHSLVKPVFVVNTNNLLITALPSLEKIDPDLAKDVVQELYDLSLLSQREMGREALSDFINRSHRILERFTRNGISTS